MNFDFGQTYLYKLHRLTTSIDTAFDQTLRKHANISLSQFTLLLSINQFQPVSQRKIATFLNITPAAVSRRVEVAQRNRWIELDSQLSDGRMQALQLTKKGEKMITQGLATLEEYLFHLFNFSGSNTNLMEHIDMLLDGIADLNTPKWTKPHAKTDQIPKAAELFLTNGRSLNRAVMDVQKAAGHMIDDEWWTKNVTIATNTLEAAERFDKAYAKLLKDIEKILSL